MTPERKAKQKLAKQLWRKNNIIKEQDRHYRRRYGVGREYYLAMVQAQDGSCAICGGMDELQIDHEHIEGYDQLPDKEKAKYIRGGTCSSCNKGLSFFNDSPARLRKAAEYLEKYNN